MLLPIIIEPLGFVLYEGPSQLDGAPIVVVATGFREKSDNPKTGRMIQTWIVRSDLKPTDALMSGEDASVCGDCIHREAKTCYVAVWQAPYQVYNSYKLGKYVPLNSHDFSAFQNRQVRIGSYGDPAAVPVGVWNSVRAVAKGITGYTHAWRYCSTEYQAFLMASCDNLKQATLAKQRGWKPFRVMTTDEAPGKGEFLCPASAEAGKTRTCSTCMACRGGTFTGQGTPVIYAHGGGAAGVKAKRWGQVKRRMQQKKGWRDIVPSYQKVA